MSEIIPYIWIGIILFAAVAEIYTYVFISIWFIPSATAAFILSLTGFHVWVQVLVFFIITLILLVLSRTIFRKSIKSRAAINDINKNSKSLIGKSAIVTREINNYKNTGAVRVGALEYGAKADDDDIIYESGLVVTIIKIDGSQAICSR
ncbi:MAG: NfeD family protein [Oscillospiraceae bacterium]|nr:NfeD family protein [Oscillospiraceae bacterium]